MTANKCPFSPCRGYATLDSRSEYLLHKGIDDSDAAGDISQSLTADTDVTKALYFWQLYSLIGDKPIIAIVEKFYERVYADTEDTKFRHAFTRLASMDHHIATQAAFWIDAMGGGRVYHGGRYRLEFHHRHNAREVMNAAGAKRWMYHMRKALDDYDFTQLNDPRIKTCILEFLKSKMMTYAYEFGWNFDESDFVDSEAEIFMSQHQNDKSFHNNPLSQTEDVMEVVRVVKDEDNSDIVNR
mmetsp:Transcript_11398/g.13783  ORF Transcript_11398/g.13783 Transcript_11398/m.13783 type:complete len:241 (+) Transcript_11398:81-803(+)